MIFSGNAVFLILYWLFTASLPLNDIPVHFNEQVEQLNIEIKLSHGSSPEKKNTHINKQTASSEKKKTYKDEQQQDARQVSVRDVSLVPSILRNSNNDNEKGKKRNRQERGAKPKIGNTKPSAKKVEKKKASKMKKGYKKKLKKKMQTLKSTLKDQSKREMKNRTAKKTKAKIKHSEKKSKVQRKGVARRKKIFEKDFRESECTEKWADYTSVGLSQAPILVKQVTK